jgi:hypothetical protein
MLILLTTLAFLSPMALSEPSIGHGHHHDPCHDPCPYGLEINCPAPIAWESTKEEVCKYWKKTNCVKKNKEVCMNVPETNCQVYGFTDCTTNQNPRQMRDDKVGGANFIGKTCEDTTTKVQEHKNRAQCVNETKEVCETTWKGDAWVNVPGTCKTLTWENCSLQNHTVDVEVGTCECRTEDIWYNLYEEKYTEVKCPKTTCTAHPYYNCETTQIEKCADVEWEECDEECSPMCDMQHFQVPKQSQTHRRWCSHVPISLPYGTPDSIELISETPHGASGRDTNHDIALASAVSLRKDTSHAVRQGTDQARNVRHLQPQFSRCVWNPSD